MNYQLKNYQQETNTQKTQTVIIDNNSSAETDKLNPEFESKGDLLSNEEALEDDN